MTNVQQKRIEYFEGKGREDAEFLVLTGLTFPKSKIDSSKLDWIYPKGKAFDTEGSTTNTPHPTNPDDGSEDDQDNEITVDEINEALDNDNVEVTQQGENGDETTTVPSTVEPIESENNELVQTENEEIVIGND